MYHPKEWKRLTTNMYLVGECVVAKLSNGKWYGTCEQEPFRQGGRKQLPCKHVRFVLRREKEEKKYDKNSTDKY